jgi:hypothetical protein
MATAAQRITLAAQPSQSRKEISYTRKTPLSTPVVTSGEPTFGGPHIIADQGIDTVHSSVAYNFMWEEYLVVWGNDRPGNDDIYAQLVSARGINIDKWRAIAAGQGLERRYPDVTFNPNWNEYLVVWEQEDQTSLSSSIRGQRVDSNGIPVGPEIIISEVGPYAGFKPAVVHGFSAGIYLVVWTNHTQGSVSNDIKGQLVSNDGSLIAKNFDVAQGNWTYSFGAPDIAYNRRQNEYLVVYQRLEKTPVLNDICAQIVRPDGTMPPAPIEIAKYTVSSTEPAVSAIPTATPKGQFLVVWQIEYAPGDRDIMGRFVFGDGNADPNDFNIINTTEDQINPGVAGSEEGNQYLVTWSETPGVLTYIYGRTVSPTGQLADPPSFIGGFLADESAVSSGRGTDFLVTYDDPVFEPNRDIWGRLWGERWHLFMPLSLRNTP